MLVFGFTAYGHKQIHFEHHFFLNLKKIDYVHVPRGVDNHLCRPISMENRLTSNFSPEPHVSYTM